MNKNLSKIKFCIISALKSSLKSAIWLFKIMIPATLLVSILDFIGVIEFASTFVEPIFAPAGLDGRGVFVFVTAIFASIYPAIAVIATLGIDFRMAIILATMMLIAHNLIVETTIQKRTGSSFIGIVTLRILTAYVAAVVLNQLLPQTISGNLVLDVASATPESWSQLFSSWAYSMGSLIVKVLLFITSLNLLQNLLREYNILDLLIKPLHPLMSILGLSKNTTFLWLVANTLGLAYGGMTMIGEVEKGYVSKEEIRSLNISIAITHSLVEDTLLFLAIGIPFAWLFFPRIICSIVVIHGRNILRKLIPALR